MHLHRASPGILGGGHHCPPTPWQAATTSAMAQTGPAEAPGQENTNTHGRAWLHGGGSRKGCQHVTSLQREAKTSEFGQCQPIPQLCHQPWEQHIPVWAAQGRCGDGPWEGYGSGWGVCGDKASELRGERKEKESSVQSRVREEKFSLWSLFEFQDRKRRGTSEFSGQAKQAVPTVPVWETCKEALQGAQGTGMCQGHPAGTHGLCLPERVHNGTPLLSHHTVVPQPGLRVDGLTHGPQHLQGLPAVPAERRGLAGAQHAVGSSSCEPAAQQSLQEPLSYPKCTFQVQFRAFSALFHRGKEETWVILASPTQPCCVQGCVLMPLGLALTF